MTDRYDQDQMLDYLEGEGDAASRAAFEQVMANDPDLASLVKELAADRELLRSMPEAVPPHGLTQEVLQGIERRMLLDGPTEPVSAPIPIARGRDLADAGSSFRWGRILGLSGMAAAVALAATLVVVFANHDPLSNTALNLAKDDPEDADPEALADAGANTPSNTEGQPGEGGVALLDDNNRGANPIAPGAGRSALTGPESAHEALLNHEGNIGDENASNGGVAAMPPDPGTGAESLRPNPLPAAHTIGQVASGDANAFLFNTSVAFDQQLTIQSESPELSRQQVIDYCVRNGIPIVETQPTSTEAGRFNNYAVVVEDEQLAEIESMINGFAKEPDAVYVQRQQAEVMSNMRGGHAHSPDADSQLQQRTRGQDEPGGITQVEARNDASWELDLLVPEKLGTEEQALQNRDNVNTYNNRVLLAQNVAPPAQDSHALGGAQSDAVEEMGHDDGSSAEDLRDEADQADAENEFSDNPERAVPRNDAGGTGRPDAVTNQADPNNADEGADEAMPADELQQEHTQESVEADDAAMEAEDQSPAQPPRRRGNWLSPQIPLVPAQPLWADPPRARLVELIIIPVEAEDADDSGDATDDEAPAEPAYKIGMLVRFTDGGSIGIMATKTGENRESLSLCLDRRTGSDTHGQFLIGAVRPTNPAANPATDDDADILRALLEADTTELAPSQHDVWEDFVEAIKAELEDE